MKCSLAFIIAVLSLAVVAQDRCLPSRSIDRVDVKDKNTLLFTMRNGTQYENKLTGSLFGFSRDPLVFEQRHPRPALSHGPCRHIGQAACWFTASLGYLLK